MSQMNDAVLGVDPGLSGALAYVSGGRLLQVYDMPTLAMSRNGKAKKVLDMHELARLIRDGPPISCAYVEQVGAMPGQGVSSVYAFGYSTGGIVGVLVGIGLTVHQVAPQVWKRYFKIGAGSGKDASRAAAKNLFPAAAGLFARVKDDGRAEAALIALYGDQTERMPRDE